MGDWSTRYVVEGDRSVRWIRCRSNHVAPACDGCKDWTISRGDWYLRSGWFAFCTSCCGFFAGVKVPDFARQERA